MTDAELAAGFAHTEAVQLPDDIDPECRELCAAMNRVPGIFTTESCCGHGGRPYRVWFSADSLESLPPVLYYFDRCHSGLSGWSVAAETDCAMNPVRFVVTGPVGGYEDARKVADLLRKYVT